MTLPWEWLALGIAAGMLIGVLVGAYVGFRRGHQFGLWDGELKANLYWINEWRRRERILAEHMWRKAVDQLFDHGLRPALRVIEGGKGDEG